jgi:hypothetical protein
MAKEIKMADASTYVELKDLWRLGEALNIEGGYPGRSAKHWANLVVILDRPLVDGIVFDDLKRNVQQNRYPFLENGVNEINEPRYLAAFVMVMGFYMQRHQSMVVHVHQAKEDAAALVEFLQQQSAAIETRFKTSCKITFRTDDPIYKPDEKLDGLTEMMLSLSQCAGLSPTLTPGTMFAPTTFIPYDIEKKTVNPKQSYTVVNQLVTDIDQILQSAHMAHAVEQLRPYKSANSTKTHIVPTEFTSADFVTTVKILHVSALWNPTKPNDIVRLD